MTQIKLVVPSLMETVTTNRLIENKIDVLITSTKVIDILVGTIKEELLDSIRPYALCVKQRLKYLLDLMENDQFTVKFVIKK